MSFFIEIRDLSTDELVDRNPVSSHEHEDTAFRSEVARCETLRNRDPDWEPITVSLIWGDTPVDSKKILPIERQKESA